MYKNNIRLLRTKKLKLLRTWQYFLNLLKETLSEILLSYMGLFSIYKYYQFLPANSPKQNKTKRINMLRTKKGSKIIELLKGWCFNKEKQNCTHSSHKYSNNKSVLNLHHYLCKHRWIVRTSCFNNFFDELFILTVRVHHDVYIMNIYTI